VCWSSYISNCSRLKVYEMKYRIIRYSSRMNLLVVNSIIMPLLTEEESALDPYRILSLELGATDQEIKKAYRKASLKWHPDKNQSEEARTFCNSSPTEAED